jgi:very-short-patch-repair endonuclease
MGCRVDENGTRKTREVDFLVIINGRMGVLECDGRSFHKIAADDHERDRNFQRQGIQFIQRYGYDACLDADKVVDDFIKLMKAFYNL